jgi:hypothetical protein
MLASTYPFHYLQLYLNFAHPSLMCTTYILDLNQRKKKDSPTHLVS